MTWILPSLLASAITAGLLYFVGLAIGWRTRGQVLQRQYDQLFNQSLVLQAGKTAAESELAYLKNTFQQMLQRPLQAMLNEEQFHGLMSLIEARMDFQAEPDPSRKPN